MCEVWCKPNHLCLQLTNRLDTCAYWFFRGDECRALSTKNNRRLCPKADFLHNRRHTYQAVWLSWPRGQNSANLPKQHTQPSVNDCMLIWAYLFGLNAGRHLSSSAPSMCVCARRLYRTRGKIYGRMGSLSEAPCRLHTLKCALSWISLVAGGLFSHEPFLKPATQAPTEVKITRLDRRIQVHITYPYV